MKINQVITEGQQNCPECGGPAFSDLLLAEKKDACYNKVRSRYKVWPSAYASGALVQCRKKGAANWGNKSKNEDVAEGDAPIDHDWYRKQQERQTRAKQKQQGVAEGYQFKGPFPFDVDHMHGGRGINLPKAETKKYFTDKKQWQRAVDDINSSKYDDNSDYIGVTGRSTVEINGREWARWSDAQQKGYIELSSMSEQGVAEGTEQEKPIKKSDWFDPTDMRSPEKQKAAYLNHLAAKKKNKNIKEQGVAEGDVDEGLGSKLAGLGLAGAMALGSGGAQARVSGDQDPNINRFTGKPVATQQSTDVAPAKVGAPSGFSKEYLQRAADPNRTGRYMISVEKAQELLNNMQEDVAEGDISQLEKDVADAPVKPIANMEGIADSNIDQLGADAGEYDYEGDMAKDDLQTIVRAARQLTGMLDDNENMPEWVQSKINKAADYVDTAADYMASNQDEPMAEADQEKIGGRHDPQDFDDMVSRLKKLAGAGPMKTVYDPNTRRYKNMPTAVQPNKKK